MLSGGNVLQVCEGNLDYLGIYVRRAVEGARSQVSFPGVPLYREILILTMYRDGVFRQICSGNVCYVDPRGYMRRLVFPRGYCFNSFPMLRGVCFWCFLGGYYLGCLGETGLPSGLPFPALRFRSADELLTGVGNLVVLPILIHIFHSA